MTPHTENRKAESKFHWQPIDLPRRVSDKASFTLLKKTDFPCLWRFEQNGSQSQCLPNSRFISHSLCLPVSPGLSIHAFIHKMKNVQYMQCNNAYLPKYKYNTDYIMKLKQTYNMIKLSLENFMHCFMIFRSVLHSVL